MFDYELMREAGVQPRHISRILGVSRVTASNWLRGVSKPHHLIEARVAPFTAAVKQLVDEGALPVAKSIPPDERSVRTVSMLAKRYELESSAHPPDSTEVT